MSAKYSSFEDLKGRISDSLTDVTKCYILIKYAENTEEEKELYREEFKTRYINFYRTILDIEEFLDKTFLAATSSNYKTILNLSSYKSKMSFVDIDSIENIDNDEIIDNDYQKKASTSATKMFFYYKNESEFGSSTRFHVETGKNCLINPKARDEGERTHIFSSMTEYFINNYLSNSSPKKYVKSM